MVSKHRTSKAKAQENQTKTPAPVPAQPVPLDEPTGLFRPDVDEEPSDDQALSWTAPEFIAHEKSQNWYVGLGALATVLVVAILVTTQDFIACAVVIVGALMFGVYGARQPRDMEYSLGSTGFNIGSRRYSYQDFRYFTIVGDSLQPSIDFMPLKRFAMVVSIHYEPADQREILAVLDGRLPHQDGKEDAIERLMHRLRF